MKISSYVDDILIKICKRLGVEIPDYNRNGDPTKQGDKILEWTINPQEIKEIDKIYNLKMKNYRKKRKLTEESEEQKVLLKKDKIQIKTD